MYSLINQIEAKKAQLKSAGRENKGRVRNALRGLQGQIRELEQRVEESPLDRNSDLRERFLQVIDDSAGLTIYATPYSTSTEQKVKDEAADLPPDVQKFQNTRGEKEFSTEKTPKLPHKMADLLTIFSLVMGSGQGELIVDVLKTVNRSGEPATVMPVKKGLLKQMPKEHQEKETMEMDLAKELENFMAGGGIFEFLKRFFGKRETPKTETSKPQPETPEPNVEVESKARKGKWGIILGSDGTPINRKWGLGTEGYNTKNQWCKLTEQNGQLVWTTNVEKPDEDETIVGTLREEEGALPVQKPFQKGAVGFNLQGQKCKVVENPHTKKLEWQLMEGETIPPYQEEERKPIEITLPTPGAPVELTGENARNPVEETAEAIKILEEKQEKGELILPDDTTEYSVIVAAGHVAAEALPEALPQGVIQVGLSELGAEMSAIIIPAAKAAAVGSAATIIAGAGGVFFGSTVQHLFEGAPTTTIYVDGQPMSINQAQAIILSNPASNVEQITNVWWAKNSGEVVQALAEGQADAASIEGTADENAGDPDKEEPEPTPQKPKEKGPNDEEDEEMRQEAQSFKEFITLDGSVYNERNLDKLWSNLEGEDIVVIDFNGVIANNPTSGEGLVINPQAKPALEKLVAAGKTPVLVTKASKSSVEPFLKEHGLEPYFKMGIFRENLTDEYVSWSDTGSAMLDAIQYARDNGYISAQEQTQIENYLNKNVPPSPKIYAAIFPPNTPIIDDNPAPIRTPNYPTYRPIEWGRWQDYSVGGGNFSPYWLETQGIVKP